MTAITCAQNQTVLDAECADGLSEILRRQTKAISIAQVAELLAVSRSKVHAMVQAGKIPHYRIGATIRFDGQALAVWLDGQQVH